MKNTLPAVSAARQPRGIVTVNGTRIDAWTEWSVDNNSFYQADTFRVSFPMYGLPSGNNADWFSSQAQIEIEVFAGFPSNPDQYAQSDLSSLIFGRVDDLVFDFTAGKIECSGRDLTSVFIDKKTSQKYVNLTSSAIATQLASSARLTPVVTATTTKVGKYYEIDHVRLQDDRSEWDLLTWLAREESFACYVKGHELHFEPKPSASGDPYVFQWIPGANGGAPRGNLTKLVPTRNLTLAKDIKVTVRSWNAKQKKGFTKTATATKARNSVIKNAGKPVTPVQEYSYTIAGLTADQAQQRATQLLAELSKHEMKATIEGPADVLLELTDPIQITGTGTGFDQTYFADSIVRSLSKDGGFGWRIEVKNHSPDTEPAI